MASFAIHQALVLSFAESLCTVDSSRHYFYSERSESSQ